MRAQVVQAHAFDRLHRVGRSAVLQRRLLQVARAADVARQRAAAAERDRRARNHDADRLMLRPVGIESSTSRVITVRVVMFCTSTTGDSAGHGDRLFDGADLQFGVDRRREVGGQFDAVALDDAEAGQREGDGVGAGTQAVILYCPVPSVTAERTFSMSAGLDASTVTPGSTAPDASLTMPAMALVCAHAAAGSSANRAAPKRFVQTCACLFPS